MKARTYLEWLIRCRARARRDMVAADKQDAFINRTYGCPDDQTIYATHETRERWECYSAALSVYRQFHPKPKCNTRA